MFRMHPNSVYQITRPARFDPQFIGIAEVFTQHKQKRKQIQKIFQDTKNNLIYVEKLNENLSKSLDEKQKELQRLQKVRQRYKEDLIRKFKEDEDRRANLEQMKRKTAFQKKKLKLSIRQRITELKNQRRRSKNEVKSNSSRLKSQLQRNENIKFQARRSMYSTIKQEKQKGEKKVDEFYRKKNLQSLNNYNKMIKMEKMKSNFYEENIQKMRQTISSISQSNQRKQRKLMNLQQDIQKLNPLESFLSSKMNRTQQLDFSRKSSMKSFSSKRPSEILLDDFVTSPGQNSRTLMRKRQNYIEFQNPESEHSNQKA